MWIVFKFIWKSKIILIDFGLKVFEFLICDFLLL